MYKLNVKRVTELVSANWSGGTTTELAIYPENSVYSKRDFWWRISSATVDVEQSDFTILPNINRIILSLNNTLTLQHESNNPIHLQPFKPYSFKGSINTKSFSKVKDFNLMYTDNCEGKVEVLEVKDTKLTDLKLKYLSGFNNTSVVLYCAVGKVEINFIGSEPLTLHEGDVMMVNLNEETDSVNMIIRNFMLKNSVLVKAEVRY
ncbi:HutD family protein [Clostridium sp. 'deep sea']|uniref:HutD/Ves family protein n=1 Tax=Clostridium sp. 'deep sea' TaxID=2779445 RepID=UPI0018967EFF|nr:HutD family protein [Clostridium sp. 'deep sea']QOR35391.1 HutD family protein [Clostridium sp. 'deep sea']